MAVRQGQVLARLDDSTARAMLQLAEAQLASARNQLLETEVRIREADLLLGRQSRLAKEGVVPAADLDTATAQVDALRARLQAARTDVIVAEQQVALRRTDMDDTVIRAPFSGMAVSKDAQPGEMISPVSAGGGFTRTGICTIVDMTSLEIEVDVNESYITRVSDKQPVRAVLDAYPDWSVPGARDHDRADRRSTEGHRAGAHRLRRARSAAAAGHGRQGHVPEGPGARVIQCAGRAHAVGADDGDPARRWRTAVRPGRRQAAGPFAATSRWAAPAAPIPRSRPVSSPGIASSSTPPPRSPTACPSRSPGHERPSHVPITRHGSPAAEDV